MRPSQLLAAVFAMSSITSAMSMSDAFDGVHGLAEVRDVLFGRQNDDSKSAQPSDQPSSAAKDEPKKTDAPEPSSTAKESGDDKNKDDKDNKDNKDNKDETSSTGKDNGSQKPSGTKTTGKPKATSYDPRLPAGGISMITPNALAGDQYYKVGDLITFAWNYTSLSQSPSAIDILASCTANQATYTIAVNQSAEETEVVWDTGKTREGQPPFLTDKYQLIIYDSDTSVSAAPRAGYLGVFNQFSFAMYTKQEYTSIADGWTCAGCSGALSHFEKMTIKALLLTTSTTFGSLLYFTYTFGLW
jgi:hypothetical protein